MYVLRIENPTLSIYPLAAENKGKYFGELNECAERISRRTIVDYWTVRMENRLLQSPDACGGNESVEINV